MVGFVIEHFQLLDLVKYTHTMHTFVRDIWSVHQFTQEFSVDMMIDFTDGRVVKAFCNTADNNTQ